MCTSNMNCTWNMYQYISCSLCLPVCLSDHNLTDNFACETNWNHGYVLSFDLKYKFELVDF